MPSNRPLSQWSEAPAETRKVHAGPDPFLHRQGRPARARSRASTPCSPTPSARPRIDWSRILLPVAALVGAARRSGSSTSRSASSGATGARPAGRAGPVRNPVGRGQAAGGRLDLAAARRRRLPDQRGHRTPVGAAAGPGGTAAPRVRAADLRAAGLPSVAWVPAAIIWFGLTDATVYFVVFMGAIPSIINGLISGVDQIPPQYRSVGTVLGASRLQLALQIILPAALPGYLGGLKQGWAFSWRSLMAAEIIAVGGTIGFGLGSMLDQGRVPVRHDHRDVRDPADPRRRHPDRTARLRARSKSGCSAAAASWPAAPARPPPHRPLQKQRGVTDGRYFLGFMGRK